MKHPGTKGRAVCVPCRWEVKGRPSKPIAEKENCDRRQNRGEKKAFPFDSALKRQEKNPPSAPKKSLKKAERNGV